MPEVIFKVKWPDGKVDACYSPSPVINNYLTEGELYSVQDFVELSSNALILASNKVLQKYGFRCTSAEDQLQRIIEKSKSFNSEDMITCLSLE